MSWLDEINAVLGAPAVAVDTEQRLGTLYRRCWVWFPSKVNHCIRIDREGDRHTLTVGSHSRTDKHVEITSRSAPTDEDIRVAVRLAWPDIAAEAFCGPQPSSDGPDLSAVLAARIGPSIAANADRRATAWAVEAK